MYQGQQPHQQQQIPPWAIELQHDFEETTDKLFAARNKFKRYRAKDCSLVQIARDQSAVPNFVEWCEDTVGFLTDKMKRYRQNAGPAANTEAQRTIERLNNKVKTLEKDLVEALNAKESIINRLSELQSRMLKQGNPGLADLSDENRPTNLGQAFKQLYEDDWTDAFSYLTDDRKAGTLKDKDGVAQLHKLLQRCNELCTEAEASQRAQIEELVTNPVYLHQANEISGNHQGNQSPRAGFVQQGNRGPPGFSQTVGPAQFRDNRQPQGQHQHTPKGQGHADKTGITARLENPIKEFFKATAVAVMDSVHIEDVIQRLNRNREFAEDIVSNKDVVKFLGQCLRLCWLMHAQQPPMHLDFTTKPGDKLETDKYTVFQKRGPLVDFIVWPTVYLHKDGPVVCKGYAEGRN